jgi:hypothetical protein
MKPDKRDSHESTSFVFVMTDLACSECGLEELFCKTREGNQERLVTCVDYDNMSNLSKELSILANNAVSTNGFMPGTVLPQDFGTVYIHI